MLTEGLGWEWVFLVNVPIGVVVLAITALKLVESRDPNPPRIDLPGQVTLVGGLFALVYGLLNAAEDGWGATPVVVALGAARRAADRVRGDRGDLARADDAARHVPQPRASRARSSPRWRSPPACSRASSTSWSSCRRSAATRRSRPGSILVPGTTVNLFCAAGTASLSKRVPPVALIGGGLVLVALGLVDLRAMLDADTTWLQLQLGFIIAMAGTGLFNPAVSAVALDVPEHQAGLATGIHDTARQAGIAVGIAALGTLIPAGGNFVDGLQNVFLAGAAITAVGALVTFVLFRARPVAAVYGEPVSPLA